MLIRCPTCQTQLEKGARFCNACGKRLDLDPDWDATVGERLGLALGPGSTVLGELGRGGFAVVFSVRDSRYKGYLAVKVMRPSLLAIDRLRERFRRETEMITRLNHPNILPILFTGGASGLVYYAMPRVRGLTLAQRLEREGALPVSAAIGIIGEIAKGLEYAHRQGIVHRDIKPANILLDERGRVSIVDFGIAKALAAKGESISITGEIVGSAEYMSPERAQGASDVDHRCDIYSLGIVAFEMLTGRLPFEAPTIQETLIMQVETPPPSIRALRPEVSPAVEAAIHQCLEKDPAKRWRSAEAAARAAGASI